MDVAFDQNGDLDRESFLVEVKNGQQVVVATVPALNAAAAPSGPAAKPAANAKK
jgi:branched-chain amino acid transport system substrate-binding protein